MDISWVAPDACRLPTAEQPLRVAEFEDLFEQHLVRVEMRSTTGARLVLEGPDGLDDEVHDLAGRETACCSFFDFTVTQREGEGIGRVGVLLEVTVPASRADVLAGLCGEPRRPRGGTGVVAVSVETPAGLRSGQVARAAGVNPQTLRYYERRGLLAAPDRTLGGHRLYPAESVTLLRVIKVAQRLGFTLDEIADLFEVGRHHHGGADSGLLARAEQKLAEVESRIADLQQIASTLRAAVDAGCDDLVECAGSDHCPVPFEAVAVEGTRDQPTARERRTVKRSAPAT